MEPSMAALSACATGRLAAGALSTSTMGALPVAGSRGSRRRRGAEDARLLDQGLEPCAALGRKAVAFERDGSAQAGKAREAAIHAERDALLSPHLHADLVPRIGNALARGRAEQVVGVQDGVVRESRERRRLAQPVVPQRFV